MQYTFRQACQRLSGLTRGFGGRDVKMQVNDAIQSLAGLNGWECLRRVFRFSSAGPCFTLPQGAAGLTRICVNGRPSHVRPQDFRFIHSGPGDLREPPPGFDPFPVSNVLDEGYFPTYVTPERPFRLLAYCEESPAPSITVRGVALNGTDRSVRIPMKQNPVFDEAGECTEGDSLETATSDTPVFTSVTEVVLGDNVPSYVTLYAVDACSNARYPIAVYHPFVKVPRFRRYSLSSVPPDAPVEILAEVRIEPLPLVRDDDVVPFDSLDPVEWMVRAQWCMQSAEVEQAGKYQSMAQSWLKSREMVEDNVQTSVVINNAFENSLGELSLDAYNI